MRGILPQIARANARHAIGAPAAPGSVLRVLAVAGRIRAHGRRQATMASQSSSASGYVDLSRRIVRRLKSARIQHQIIEALDKSFDAALAEDNIVLSRAERKRLLTQVSQNILEDMLSKLERSLTAKD
jgi:hypothetical protein